MASEQFSLCWDNFHKNMSMGMRSLLETEDLVDVTLAVEGRYLKAHKMVLSVCSPYFRELFQSNPCKHPIVFMKDVSYIALSDLLHFMYQGEVQVAQENLSTFIKTAEALQIKGLTGDNGIQNESESDQEVEKPVEETTGKRSHDSIEQKPTGVSQPKRFSGPASKRPKFSNVTATSVPSPTVAATTGNKYEVASVTTNNVESSDDVNLKMEPNESIEQAQSDAADESQLEQYGDETNAFEMADETEDFSLMESSNDEPKPGTSTEAGDNQDDNKKWFGQRGKKRVARTRYVFNGFVYHTSVVRTNPAIRYLICSKYGSTGCHARAVLPLNGSIDELRVTKVHNHPPDDLAEEKHQFFQQLKEITQASPNSALKIIFEGIISVYPRLASEMSFQSIRTSMRRWRKEAT